MQTQDSVQFFGRRRETNARLVSELSQTFSTVTTASTEEVQAAQNSLQSEFIQGIVLLKLRRELRSKGLSLSGNIDWKAIGDFIKTIAPIIMEFLLLILESDADAGARQALADALTGGSH